MIRYVGRYPFHGLHVYGGYSRLVQGFDRDECRIAMSNEQYRAQITGNNPYALQLELIPGAGFA